MSDEKFTIEQVIWVKPWSRHLFSFAITRPAGYRFSAGQFARIGLELNDRLVMRAYSIVSSPFEEVLEFFSVIVPEGELTPHLQHIKVGDSIWLEKTAYGFLTLARYQQPAPNDLWLLASGTGVAPFLSILQDFEVWERYQYIILAYSVRTAQELAYQDKIQQLKAQFGNDGAQFTFLPIVTRDPMMRLHQRLPQLIASGQLVDAAPVRLDAQHSHVMLCGNPQMVEDTKELIKAQGLTLNRRGVGNIAVENYW